MHCSDWPSLNRKTTYQPFCEMEAILLTWRVRADYIYDTLLTTSNGLKWPYEFGSKPVSS